MAVTGCMAFFYKSASVSSYLKFPRSMKNIALAACAMLWLLTASCGHPAARPTELFPVGVNNQFGFIDRTGKTMISPQFAGESCFRDGLALAATKQDEPHWGYIDKTGKYIISPKYIDGTIFAEGMAFVVAENSDPQAIDTTGKVHFTLNNALKAEQFSEGVAAFSRYDTTAQTEQWGFVDMKGNITIQPAFSGAGYFKDGLCPVRNAEGKYGYISKDGKVAIDYQFDKADVFRDKMAAVSVNGQCGIIGTQGKFIINPQYQVIIADGDLFMVGQNSQCGWVDKGGKPAIDTKYDAAWPFYGGDYAAVKTGDKWGYIDRKGNMVIQPQFDDAYCFDGDVALVRLKNKTGLIDKAGKFLAAPQFDGVAEDYNYMTTYNLSGFTQVTSDKPSPLRTADKWLHAIFLQDYQQAIKFSTAATQGIVETIAGFSGSISDSTKQKMARTIIEITGVAINKDMAVATFRTSDAPDKENQLNLVLEGSQWLVRFSKEDLKKGQATE